MQVGHDVITINNLQNQAVVRAGQATFQLLLLASTINFNQQRLWADRIQIPSLHKAVNVSGNSQTNTLSVRKIAFLIFIFIPLFGLTQGKEFYQLQNKGKPNYTESNHFFTDSIWRFNQTVAYDEANVFDEETWTKLEIRIKDTATFLQRRILDFSDDSLVAKHYFTVLNVWSNNQDSTSITGQVQLLSLTHEGILLKLNLTVTSLKTQNQFIYTGERMFYNFYKTPSVMDLYDRIPSIKYRYDSIR